MNSNTNCINNIIEFGIKIIYNISIALLSGIFSLFLISSLGFIFKININIIYPILSLALTYLILWKSIPKSEDKFKNFLIQATVLTALLIFCLILAITKTDYSYDGRTYHQLNVIFLSNGWNPIYDNIDVFAKSLYGFNSNHLLWCENYPKFMEIISSNVFILTHNIESGKIINYISGIILFFYSLYIFHKPNFAQIKTYQKFLISILFIINPVYIAQIFTYYLDWGIYVYFMIMLFAIVDLETDNTKTNIPFAILLMTSVILVNIKLGGALYCIVTWFLYGLYLLIYKNYEKFKKLVQTILLIIFIFLLTGINPYFTNIEKHRHPLYPLVGENKIDIITPSSPKIFNHNMRIYNFLLSSFSRVNNFGYSSNENPELKIPFTVYKSEFGHVAATDARICGFGVWWSAILIFSIISVFFIKFNSLQDKKLAFLIFSILLLLSIINPYSWWARYVPHIWAIPVFILFYNFLSERKSIPKNIFLYLFIIIIITNSVFSMIYVSQLERHYRKDMNLFLENIKAKNKTILLFDNSQDNLFYQATFLQKLSENNISYQVVDSKYYNANLKTFEIVPYSLGEHLLWSESHDK